MTGSGRVSPIAGWRIDLARLRRDHRGRLDFSGHQPVADLSLPAAEVPDHSVRHELDIDATTNDAVVTGSVSFSWRIECRRCLNPVDGTDTVTVNEIYQPEPVDEEIWPIVDDRIDLEPMVRESVLLALPSTVVCRDECSGPADGDYDVAVPVDADSSNSVDPRWAALDELKFEAPPE